MAAPNVGPVKAMVRSVELGRVAEYLEELRESCDHSLRTKLAAFARDHGAAL
jgi:phosphotransferase system enzyme I (PtsP)